MTCVAGEMISVRPDSVNSVPSVVTNDEMPTTETTSPLNRPTSIAAINAPIIAGTSGSPTFTFSL